MCFQLLGLQNITYRYMYLINIFGYPLIQNLCGSRFARLPMGGTRSISEDSVFKPEQKEGGLDPLRQTAISMEQVNQQFKVRGGTSECARIDFVYIMEQKISIGLKKKKDNFQGVTLLI